MYISHRSARRYELKRCYVATMLAVVTTLAFMCLGPDALGSTERRDHIKEAVELGATCACKAKCTCATNECCHEAEGHVGAAKKHLAQAKHHMEQLKDAKGKEHSEVVKLKLQLAAKDNELAKLRAEARERPPPDIQGAQSKVVIASLEKKAARLTSHAIGDADDAAALSAKLAAEPSPTVAEITAAKKASIRAEVKMKEANAASKMAVHAKHSLQSELETSEALTASVLAPEEDLFMAALAESV